jgi:hypothetical protein
MQTVTARARRVVPQFRSGGCHAPPGSGVAAMIQVVYCLFLLIPVVAIPVLLFLISTELGIAGTVVSLVLSIPLVIATYAHLDLVRAKSRYNLSNEELDEFSRLVPRLARKPEFAGLRSRELRRSTKQAAADLIYERRGRAAG